MTTRRFPALLVAVLFAFALDAYGLQDPRYLQ
jgi:hypothetical protein